MPNRFRQSTPNQRFFTPLPSLIARKLIRRIPGQHTDSGTLFGANGLFRKGDDQGGGIAKVIVVLQYVPRYKGTDLFAHPNLVPVVPGTHKGAHMAAALQPDRPQPVALQLGAGPKGTRSKEEFEGQEKYEE